MMELPIDYEFSEQENMKLVNSLLSIKQNPYLQYEKFAGAVSVIAQSNEISSSFKDKCINKKNSDLSVDPFFVIRNAPVDPDLPYLDYSSPVTDKRTRKATYVAEGFLQLYAELMAQEPIGYMNDNDGDIFQDIHPMKRMNDTQSQKTSKNICFHKELTSHFVRPDWVNVMGLRSSPKNIIYTCFVKNTDLLNALSKESRNIIGKPLFHTPYDELTLSGKNVPLEDEGYHPILGDASENDIRFFEHRTRGTTKESRKAVAEIVDALHKVKKRVSVLTGVFVGASNNESMHNKEVIEITDEQMVNNRWLMKTVNVTSFEKYLPFMRKDNHRIVYG